MELIVRAETSKGIGPGQGSAVLPLRSERHATSACLTTGTGSWLMVVHILQPHAPELAGISVPITGKGGFVHMTAVAAAFKVAVGPQLMKRESHV